MEKFSLSYYFLWIIVVSQIVVIHIQFNQIDREIKFLYAINEVK